MSRQQGVAGDCPRSDEQIFYEDNRILVTQYRFMVSGETYPMADVATIKYQVDEPSRNNNLLLHSYGGVALTLVGFLLIIYSIANEGNRVWGYLLFYAGLSVLSFTVCYAILNRFPIKMPRPLSNLYSTPQPTHVIILVSQGVAGDCPRSEDETAAFSSQDHVMVGRILEALDRAMAARS